MDNFHLRLIYFHLSGKIWEVTQIKNKHKKTLFDLTCRFVFVFCLQINTMRGLEFLLWCSKHIKMTYKKLSSYISFQQHCPSYSE